MTAIPFPRLGLLLAMTALATGCTMGPDFVAPAAPPVSRYTIDERPAPAAESAQSLVSGQPVASQWWQAFGDARLDALVQEALTRHPDLQAAQAALRAAQASAEAQRSSLWPTVDAHFTPTRQSIASSTASPQSSGASTYTLHTAQLNLSYSLDVFGATRRQIESAEAQTRLLAFQRDAAALTLSTNLVVAVIQSASLRAQLTEARRLTDLATRQLDLTRRQQRAGAIGPADVAAQELQLAQIAATLPPLEKQWEQSRDLIAVLTGRLPAEATGLPVIELDALRLPATLPLSLPSALVRQRPDIRAAEAQMQTASAQIGVAAAARLPSITLTANTGSSAETLGQLFKAGTGFWGLAADLAQPLFDAGALKSRETAARASFDQAASQYRSTVLAAFQNVADTLGAIDADARTLQAAAQADASAARALDIALRQWKSGAIAYPLVLAAEQAHGQTGLALIQARAARLIDVAALYQALGGGWVERDDADRPQARAER